MEEEVSMTTLWWVQLAIIAFYCVGAIGMAVWSYLDSGEPFDPRKFAASMELTVMGAMTGAMGMANPNIILKSDGILLYCLAAMVTGFGTVEATRKLSKSGTAIVKKIKGQPVKAEEPPKTAENPEFPGDQS